MFKVDEINPISLCSVSPLGEEISFLVSVSVIQREYVFMCTSDIERNQWVREIDRIIKKTKLKEQRKSVEQVKGMQKVVQSHSKKFRRYQKTF